MSFPPRTREFFVTGGALRPNDASYVQRSADGELFELTQASQFSYVLTPRQMGKTSLMHRTAERLKQAENVRTARIDLTSLGTASVEEWYLALLAELTRQFRLSVDLKAWWDTHAGLGAVTRFTNFIRDVLLSEIDAQVVIFIDEIDFTLSLDFSDEFFAAIRAFYNARAQEAAFERLTFVLLGAATPPDLIKDRTRTPFNIGKGLILSDFSLAEAQVLQNGLEKTCPEQGAAIFRQIYQWTDGHPYLTQTLCQAVVKAKQEEWSPQKIDELVEQLFFSKQGSKEENLQLVQDRILTHPQQRSLLKLYRKVYEGEKITDEAQSIEQNQLKLSGLIKAEDGYLQVRNNIYREVFNLTWINAHTAIDWTRFIAVSAVVVMLFFFGLLAQSSWAGFQADRLAGQIHQSSSATEQMAHLADLFRLQAFVPPENYAYQAKDVFYGLSLEEQQALFDHYDGPKEELIEVINGIYTTFADVNEDNSSQPVLEAMQMALTRGKHSEESVQLEKEIAHWLEARRLFQPSSYNEASAEYDEAIKLNGSNPATRYERGRVKTKLGQSEEALADFDAVIAISQNVSVPANPTATPTVTSTPRATSTSTATGTGTPLPATSTPTSSVTPSIVIFPTEAAYYLESYPPPYATPDLRLNPTSLPMPYPAPPKIEAWVASSTPSLISSPLASLTATSTPTATATAIPAATATSIPTVTPTLIPLLGITSEFDTPEKMKEAIQALVEQESRLLRSFATANDDQYVNLQTISLPPPVAFEGTPFPQPLRAISGDNVAQIRQLARWGKGRINNIAISPDGQTLAVASSIGIYLYDVETLKQVMYIKSQAAILGVAFSPDGTRLASGSSDGTVRLWSVDGTLLNTLDRDTSSVNSVAFSPDGTRLASASFDTVRLWSSDGTLLYILDGHSLGISSVTFSLDSKRLASASFDTVRLWSKDGVLLDAFDEYTSLEWSVAPDDMHLASASENGVIRLSSIDGTLFHTLDEHISDVSAGASSWYRTYLAFDLDGSRFVSTSDNGKIIHLWSKDGTLLETLDGHTSDVKSVAFNPNGTGFASASSDTVHLWSNDGTLLNTLEEHTSSVRSVVFSPDGTSLVSASDNATLRLWSTDGTLLDNFEANTSDVNSVAFSPDGTRLASASDDGTVRLWSADGTLLDSLEGHTSSVNSVAFSPDGTRLASASDDRTVRLWSVDGTLLSTLEGHTSDVNSVAFSPDGTRLASASDDNTVRLWSADGTLLKTLDSDITDGRIFSLYGTTHLAFSPDSTRLAYASVDNRVRLWSADGQLLQTLEGHTERVLSVAFSPDGTRLASASDDNTVRLWSADGTLVSTLEGHTLSVLSVAFSPDGTLLASSSSDGTVRLWGVPP